MILASHGLIASQIASFDADAVAFFGRVTTAGGSLSATEKAAVNQLVLDLKANSLWTPMKAIYPMVGASAAACAQNLKSSSFTGTFTATGWTFASTGVTPNGTSAYMDSGLNASTELTNNCSLGFYSRTNSQLNAGDCGRYGSGVDGLAIQSRWSDGKMYATNMLDSGASAISVTNSTSAGFIGTSRTTNTNFFAFRNSTVLSTNTTTVSGVRPNLNLYLASDGSSYSSREYCFFYISDSLTTTNTSNFYTAVQAFQTTLSRNV